MKIKYFLPILFWVALAHAQELAPSPATRANQPAKMSDVSTAIANFQATNPANWLSPSSDISANPIAPAFTAPPTSLPATTTACQTSASPSTPQTSGQLGCYMLYAQLFGFRGDNPSYTLAQAYPGVSSVANLPTMFGVPMCPEASSMQSQVNYCALQTEADWAFAHAAVSPYGSHTGFYIRLPATGQCANLGNDALKVNNNVTLIIGGDEQLASQMCHGTAPVNYTVSAASTTRQITLTPAPTGNIAGWLVYDKTNGYGVVSGVKVVSYSGNVLTVTGNVNVATNDVISVQPIPTNFLSYGIAQAPNTDGTKSGSLTLQNFGVSQNGLGGRFADVNISSVHPSLVVRNVEAVGYGVPAQPNGFAVAVECKGCSSPLIDGNTLRGNYLGGEGDIAVSSATSTTVTVPYLPPYTAVGETLNDLTNGMAIVTGCGIADMNVVTDPSGNGNIIGVALTVSAACAGTLAVASGDDLQIQSFAIDGEGPSFGYYITNNKIDYWASGCIGTHAHVNPAIQGLVAGNNSCGNTQDYIDMYNSVGGTTISVDLTGPTQVQISGTFFHGESVSQLNAIGLKYYAGAGGNGASSPPNARSYQVGMDLINNAAVQSTNGTNKSGNNNTVSHFFMQGFPGAAEQAIIARSNDNNDNFDHVTVGAGAISPVSEGYQFGIGMANATDTSDVVNDVRMGVAAANQVAGDTTITLQPIPGPPGWAPHFPMWVFDTALYGSVPYGDEIDYVTGTLAGGITLHLMQPLTGPISGSATVGTGDPIAMQTQVFDESNEWETAWCSNAVTCTIPAGSTSFYLEPYFIPSGIVNTGVAQYVKDISMADSNSIPDNCSVTVSATTGLVTLGKLADGITQCATAGPIIAGNVDKVGDILDFYIAQPFKTVVTVNAPTVYAYTPPPSTGCSFISDNYDNIIYVPAGSLSVSRNICGPLAPRIGQDITVTDVFQFAVANPSTWVNGVAGTGQTVLNNTGDFLHYVWDRQNWASQKPPPITNNTTTKPCSGTLTLPYPTLPFDKATVKVVPQAACAIRVSNPNGNTSAVTVTLDLLIIQGSTGYPVTLPSSNDNNAPGISAAANAVTSLKIWTPGDGNNYVSVN